MRLNRRFRSAPGAVLVLVLSFLPLIGAVTGCESRESMHRRAIAQQYKAGVKPITDELDAVIQASEAPVPPSLTGAAKREFMAQQNETMATKIDGLIFRLDRLLPLPEIREVHQILRELLQFLATTARDFGSAIRQRNKWAMKQVVERLDTQTSIMKKRLDEAMERAGIKASDSR